MKYSGAEITIKLLQMAGIDTITGIPGGSNLPLYNALYKSEINHILARHEQGAAFISQGMARSTGKAAVCFGTSGPGATNLITAIADAKLDSVPLVAITGQVPYNLIGTDAFQEVDIYGLTIPITKHNFFVRSVKELFRVIPEAFRIAQSDRPGPVLVDIPKDIQKEVIEVTEWPDMTNLSYINSSLDYTKLQVIADLINNSKAPIVYGGGGLISSNASLELDSFTQKASIPFVLTLMGLGVASSTNPLNLGMLGMHGAPYTNILMNDADLIIALGVRFDDRATGNVSKFCPNATIIHIDIDSSEINKIKQAHISLKGNIKDILSNLTPYINKSNREEWIEKVNKYKELYPQITSDSDDFFNPINLIKNVSKIVPSDSIITTDVGQHQMWVAQHYPINTQRTLLTSGGLGTMGFGLPAAIGASLANKDKTIVCFTGDGSILMNIQELATLAELDLNVKVIIINNHHLGLVRQQQELFFDKNYIASKFIKNPDFKTIGLGFGVNSVNLNDFEDPYDKLQNLLRDTGPCLINVDIDEEALVLPMVPPGGSNIQMIGSDNYE